MPDDFFKMLYLGASPKDLEGIDVAHESQTLEAFLKDGEIRVNLVVRPAISRSNIQSELSSFSPHVIHISAHGATGTGEIVVRDEHGRAAPISHDDFGRLFELQGTDPVQCVVLAACNGEAQAYAVREFVDCVILFPGKLESEDATYFAKYFYRFLTYGNSIKNAYERALLEFGMAGRTQPETYLYHRSGIDPGNVFPGRRVVNDQPHDIPTIADAIEDLNAAHGAKRIFGAPWQLSILADTKPGFTAKLLNLHRELSARDTELVLIIGGEISNCRNQPSMIQILESVASQSDKCDLENRYCESLTNTCNEIADDDERFVLEEQRVADALKSEPLVTHVHDALSQLARARERCIVISWCPEISEMLAAAQGFEPLSHAGNLNKLLATTASLLVRAELTRDIIKKRHRLFEENFPFRERHLNILKKLREPRPDVSYQFVFVGFRSLAQLSAYWNSLSIHDEMRKPEPVAMVSTAGHSGSHAVLYNCNCAIADSYRYQLDGIVSLAQLTSAEARHPTFVWQRPPVELRQKLLQRYTADDHGRTFITEHIHLRRQGRRNELYRDLAAAMCSSGATQRCILLGEAGSGKSTQLRFIAAEMLRHQLPGVAPLAQSRHRHRHHEHYLQMLNKLPLLITTKDLVATLLDDQGVDLETDIANVLLTDPSLLTSALEYGDAVLIIDGLDEIVVPSERERLFVFLRKVLRRFAGCPFVLSTRPEADPVFEFSTLPRFHLNQLCTMVRLCNTAISRKSTTSPVYSYPPQGPFGLRDIAGNLYEWSEDWHHQVLPPRFMDKAEQESKPYDPPNLGYHKFVLGGSFKHGHGAVQIDDRFMTSPENLVNVVGFRIAISEVDYDAWRRGELYGR